MPEDYKATLNRIYEEVFTQGRAEVADEIIAADAVDHEMQGARGPAALKEALAMFRGAFPDLKMTMDDAIVEGNQVAARFTMTGTHKGEFQGIPPTGKSVKIGGIDIVRFEGDKAVEHWGYTDQMGLMQQLGVMPPA
jgi:steroid delta-isomerase-like uncharacterized protein